MKILSFILLLLLFIVEGRGQNPNRFLTFSVKDGLSQSSVHAIHRDNEGLLWVGTQDGLNSFDGKLFTTYRYSQADSTSLSDQFILKILEDKKGNLWVGTRNGLNYFNKKTRQFKRYYITEEVQHNFQSSYENIFLINDDSLLIEKDDLYLLETKNGRFTKIYSPENKAGNWIVGQLNNIWFVDEQQQVFAADNWRKGQFKKLGKSPILLQKNSFNYYSPYATSVYIYYLHP